MSACDWCGADYAPNELVTCHSDGTTHHFACRPPTVFVLVSGDPYRVVRVYESAGAAEEGQLMHPGSRVEEARYDRR